MPVIALAVEVNAPRQRVFAAVTDWRGQDRWVPLTRVRAGHAADGVVGSEILAVTGLGPLRVLDTMTITRWDVPERVDVVHTGAFVRGIGVFRVLPITGERTKFIWAEAIDAPFGAAGQLGFAVLKPLLRGIFRARLRKFARLVETGELGFDRPVAEKKTLTFAGA